MRRVSYGDHGEEVAVGGEGGGSQAVAGEGEYVEDGVGVVGPETEGVGKYVFSGEGFVADLEEFDDDYYGYGAAEMVSLWFTSLKWYRWYAGWVWDAMSRLWNSSEI